MILNKMKIDIWSDIACPFCYIGKRKLDNALANFAHRDNVDIVLHSYELNPDLPKTNLGRTFYTHFAKLKNVSEDKAREIQLPLIKTAKEVGLDYDFENLVVANTRDALRLVKHAAEYNLASEAEEVLFDAYFVKGKDISDRATLLDLAASLGLGKDAVETMLDSNKYVADIEADMKYSEEDLKLEYIPFYVFNQTNMIQGAIDSEEYLRMLEKSYTEWQNNETPSDGGDIISGQSCSIDGVCT